MTYIKKEAVYDLLADLEGVYPEATAALRVAVAEMPEAVHIDLEKLKTTILEKKVNLFEAEYIEYKRWMNELHQHR